MEINYPNDLEPTEVVERIKNELGGRKLGKILTFEISETELNVTIKKMGTSTLSFTRSSDSENINWVLSKEKIALTHRPLKSDMIEKLTAVIKKTGGEVTS